MDDGEGAGCLVIVMIFVFGVVVGAFVFGGKKTEDVPPPPSASADRKPTR